jgi:hypothetical protein
MRYKNRGPHTSLTLTQEDFSNFRASYPDPIEFGVSPKRDLLDQPPSNADGRGDADRSSQKKAKWATASPAL